MAGLIGAGPAELILAARVARMYYLESISKVDIADQLSISRFRVARLLESARASGMVRIEIGLPGGTLNADLSARVCSAYGLQHAFVLDIPGDDEVALRQRLGEAVGEALMDIVGADDVLGMAWARSLSSVSAPLTRFPPCPVVQLTGALSRPDGNDLLGLVRSVARIGGGPAHVFYAPMIVNDTRTANSIRRQPDVTRAFTLVGSVTIAVVGIGAWRPGLSTIFDALPGQERDALTDVGVEVDLSGVFLGSDGRPVDAPMSSRMIVTPGPALERIPLVLAAAYGVQKRYAVDAALRGGIVNGLVTHSDLARALLELSEGTQRPVRSGRGAAAG